MLKTYKFWLAFALLAGSLGAAFQGCGNVTQTDQQHTVYGGISS